MSFEGYFQYVCKNGHYYTADCLEVGYDDDPNCSVCNEPPIWTNIVDVTNGSFEGNERIDGYVELVPKSEKKCECCGHILEQTFEIPESAKKRTEEENNGNL